MNINLFILVIKYSDLNKYLNKTNLIKNILLKNQLLRADIKTFRSEWTFYNNKIISSLLSFRKYIKYFKS